MSIVPFNRQGNELARLHKDMDELITTFFGGWPSLTERPVWPALDITETDDAILVRAEVPGCKADDVDISVKGNILTISGEKKEEKEEKSKGYYHAERSYGSFRRDISLPTEVDPAKVEANCKDGILTVRMPKEERVKAVKVKVKGQ